MTNTLQQDFNAFYVEWCEYDMKDFGRLHEMEHLLKTWFVVPYEIIGSRCNGTYLVKAHNKAEAKKFVRALDEDYVVRYGAENYIKHADEMATNPFTEICTSYNKDKSLPDNNEVIIENIEFGFTYCLECGT